MADETLLSNEEEVWRLREQMVRRSFEAVFNFKEDELERERMGEASEADKEAATRSAVIASAGAVLIGAFVLRLGGRAALASALGIDAVADLGIGDKIDQVVAYSDALGVWSVGVFFAAWIVAKVFLLDFVSIVLAIASGVVFGGVIEGATLSAIGATLGSLAAFQLSRTLLQQRVADAVDAQPVARALGKVVEEDGFRTVFVLRLSPIIPIPLGAYAYIYGASSLDVGSFASATFLGSFKPYLVDSYLGVFSKQILDGDSLDTSKDIILLLGVGALVLVGVFATDLAGQTFDRVQREMKVDAKARSELNATETTAEWTIGPWSSGTPARLAKSLTRTIVPAPIREEVAGVWERLRAFCDDQWDEAVAGAVERRREKEGVLSGGRSRAREEAGAVAQGREGGVPSVATLLYGPADENEEMAASRRRLAEWSFEGARPWRQGLTSLLFTFAVFDACVARWTDYPEDGIYNELPSPNSPSR